MTIDRGIDEEASAPKYAHVELERRWRIDPRRRPPLADSPVTLIEDRYIADTRLRLRRMHRPDLDETKWKLTKKYECAEARARPIVTAYLIQHEYDVLSVLPALALVKRRHHVPCDGRWWSVDVFEGDLAGLELVEVEADDRATLDALVPPAWAGREVTDDPRYQGGALAAYGTPED